MKKKEWHRNNKKQVYDACKGICFKCDKKVPYKYGLIHHLTYRNIDKKSIYLFQGVFLLEIGKIKWCCKTCHIDIHKTLSIDNCTRIIEDCCKCNKRPGRIERALLVNLDKPICRKCFVSIKKRKKLTENGQLDMNFDG